MEKSSKIEHYLTLTIIFIAIISLFFTFTNHISISALISGGIVVLPFYIIYQKEKTNVTKILFITFVYFAISALIYNYKSLFDYGFYRRDGNIFITFAPLLILSLLSFNVRTKKIINIFLPVVTIINAICIIKHYISPVANEYAFLFKTHNAAGGYIITILSLYIGKFIAERDKKSIPFIIINFIGLLLTDSRGSIIGLIIALICVFFLNKKSFRHGDKFIFIAMLTAIIAATAFITAYSDFNVLEENVNTFALPSKFDNTIIGDVFKLLERSHTIVNRLFYLWPRALKLSTISPIVGTGFGSYNDLPYEFNRGIEGYFCFNANSNIVYNDAHAHNTYLHIFAETGLIGFSLIIFLIFIIRKNILKLTNISLKYSLYLAWMSIVFSAFTEHRLTTPSQVLPFTILFGLALAEERWLKDNNNRRKEFKQEKKVENLVVIYDCNYVNGGAAKVAIETAKLMSEKGLNVYFFSAVNGESRINDERIKYVYTNQAESLNDKNKLRGAINGIWNFKARKELGKLLDKLDNETTIIHIHGWTKALSSSIFGIIEKKNFKYVTTYHDYFSACPNGGYYNYKRDHICKNKSLSLKCVICNCDSRNRVYKIYRLIRQFVQNKIVDINDKNKYIVSISEFSYNVLKSNIRRRDAVVRRIYNPINNLKNKKIKDISENKNYIYVGRISKEKNVETFCEAISKLGYKGIAVGDGNQKEYLENKYKNIKFVGWKNNEEVIKIMQDARCLVFPSNWYECAPLTILEAHSIGLPVIVSKDCAGIEFVPEELTFNPKDVEELIEKIELIKSDEIAIKYSTECYNNFYNEEKYFNYDSQMLDYYNYVINDIN